MSLWASRIAPHRPLQTGDMINTELEAKYGGYIAQTVQAACLGKIPRELQSAFDASMKVFDELLKFMKPGVTFRELVTHYRKLVQENSGDIPKGMLLHGRGIGEDRPQITGELEGDIYNSAYLYHASQFTPRRRQCFRSQTRCHAGERCPTRFAAVIPWSLLEQARAGWARENLLFPNYSDLTGCESERQEGINRMSQGPAEPVEHVTA